MQILQKRSCLFCPFHHLPVIIIKIQVDENLAKKSCPFGPFYHSVVHVVYILVMKISLKDHTFCARFTIY